MVEYIFYSLNDFALRFSIIRFFFSFAFAFAVSTPVSASSCNIRNTFDEFVHFVFFPSVGLRSASDLRFGFLNFISIPAAFLAFTRFFTHIYTKVIDYGGSKYSKIDPKIRPKENHDLLFFVLSVFYLVLFLPRFFLPLS